jgi:predicted XRE-type DNA-binding protein
VIDLAIYMNRAQVLYERAIGWDLGRMGILQAKVSGMMRGDFSNLSERKLMACLNRLGYDKSS